MSKTLYFEQSQDRIKQGVNILEKAVSVTMGPKGRNVIIEREGMIPHITKDGVTVANNIELEDQASNIGAQLVKEVAIRTANEAGDGTTTATVLANAIFNKGSDIIKINNLNPILFKRSFDKMIYQISDYIKSKAINIDGDYNKIKNVASISSNNDEEIGELIAAAFEKATTDGIILIEETTNSETSINSIDGMEIDKGYESHYFINNEIKNTCEFQMPFILLYDKKIESMKDVLHILEMSVQQERPLVIVADDYGDEFLSMLVSNNIRGSLKACPIKIPGFGTNRTGIMTDLACITGGTYIREEDGITLKDVTLKHLGQCSKFISSRTSSIFIEGNSNEADLLNRANYLRNILSNKELPRADRENVTERLAKLTGGVVIINVGANSDIELKEKRDRIDDALSATRAAISEGIVSGAGSTYIRAFNHLITLYPNPTIMENLCLKVIEFATNAPLIKLCENAGIPYNNNLFNKIANNDNYGINILTEEVTDLIKDGVIDPAKVVRVALENAASIASLFLTTSCLIINNKK